jgi:hypothetical protein
MDSHRKSIVLRFIADILKRFALCRHWVIQFKRYNAVNAKNSPIYRAKRITACKCI